jgi:hypothetical protein
MATTCYVTSYHDAFQGKSNVYWPKSIGRYRIVNSHDVISFMMRERERGEREKKIVNVGVVRNTAYSMETGTKLCDF